MNRIREHLLPFLVILAITSLSVAIFPSSKNVPPWLQSFSTFVIFGFLLLIGATIIVHEYKRAELDRFKGRRFPLYLIVLLPIAALYGFAMLAFHSLVIGPQIGNWAWVQGYCCIGLTLEAALLALCYLLVLVERLVVRENN